MGNARTIVSYFQDPFTAPHEQVYLDAKKHGLGISPVHTQDATVWRQKASSKWRKVPVRSMDYASHHQSMDWPWRQIIVNIFPLGFTVCH